MGIELKNILEHETNEALHSEYSSRHSAAEYVRRSHLIDGELGRADDIPAMELAETLAAARTDEMIADLQASTIDQQPRNNPSGLRHLSKAAIRGATMMGAGQLEPPPEVLEEIDPRTS